MAKSPLIISPKNQVNSKTSSDPFTRLLDPKEYKDLARWLKKGEAILLDRQWSASCALTLARIQALGYPVVCISPDNERQSRLMSELEALCPKANRLCFPSWETLPSEKVAPSPDIVGLRMGLLWQLVESQPVAIQPTQEPLAETALVQTPLVQEPPHQPPLVLLTTQSLQQRTIAPKMLKKQTLEIKKGLHISQSQFIEKLLELGYTPHERVGEKGQFAKRVGLVDLYLPHELEPIRIEWWGDEIDSLRIFDLHSQRTLGSIHHAWLLPADELKVVDPKSGILDYLPKKFVLVFDEMQLIEDRYVEIDSMPGSLHSGYVSFHEALEKFLKIPKVYMSHQAIDALCEPQFSKMDDEVHVSFEAFGKKEKAIFAPTPFMRLQERFVLSEHEFDFFRAIATALVEEYDVYLLYASEAERSMAQKHLLPDEINHPNLHWAPGYLSESIAIDSMRLLLAPIAQYTHHHRLYRPKLRISHTPMELDLLDLTPGEHVVHLHHGIGIFRGVERQKDLQGQPKEHLVIEYAQKANIYVPIEHSHLLVRYEAPEHAPLELHQIGSTRWKKQYQQASDSIQGYAKQLIELYAARLMDKSVLCPFADSDLMRQFEGDFPYEMTEDQQESIAVIKKDLSQPTPMDRLICGDVGYGKTEVAMRAAFKIVADSASQVAVLCPTTVLTLQHYETFMQRMGGFGVRIAALSRFTKAQEKKKILEEVLEGKIDILIGTHRLLSQDVAFNKLGLLIIDEEQRFGVKAKEHLKLMKKDVNCLTLSATPIPRTLHLSLMGGKQLSTIATPPHDRQPITTVICEKKEEVIRSALQRELGRGGQAFYVKNDIDALSVIGQQIKKLMPTIRLAMVHGQMNPTDIEKIFFEFKNHKLDLLIATTIVETGIDIPNANTIFIDPCDEFGLSDLYQLRGRVGRWNRKAYAYLVYPPKKTLSPIAKKRLEAIAQASGYGAGMKLALRDLSLRGCGELVGEQQSGHLSSIGFSLYCRLLQRAMQRLQGQSVIDIERVRLDHNLPAVIPEEYVDALSLRLEIYQRAAQIINQEQLELLKVEIADRYGKMPEALEWLFTLSRIRFECAAAHIETMKLFYTPQTSSLEIQFEKPLGSGRSQRIHSKVRVQPTPESVLQTLLSYMKPQAPPTVVKPKIDLQKFQKAMIKDHLSST